MKKTYINGKIFTSDPTRPYVSAFAAEDGRITAVGSAEEVLTDAPGEIVDLEGRTVIPGLIDAHMHPIMLADYAKQISALPPVCYSIKDIQREIRKARAAQGPDKWIFVWGCDEGKLAEKRYPDIHDLDEACDDAPVYVLRVCGHVRSCNSAALKLAGIDRDTPDPQGGTIEHDENGDLTGILTENAGELVGRLVPPQGISISAQNLKDLGDLLSSQGIVAVADMGEDDDPAWEIFHEAAKLGFAQDAALYLVWDFYVDRPDFALTPEQTDPNAKIRVAGLKLIGDGSVSGHTAWMDEPYLSTGTCGIPVYSDELVESAIAYCKANHLQLAVHAMGGRAIARIVDRAYREEDWMDGAAPYVRVEHVTEPREDSMDKVIEKGMAFATQPVFFFSEIESYLMNLGQERTKTTYPIHRMLEKGLDVCLSTDAPATSWAVPSDPFINMQAAVTRVAFDGTDCGKEQAIDVETAVRLYTDAAARATGFRGLGRIAPGYRESFAVLSEDLFTVPAERIGEVHPLLTVHDDKEIYKA